MSRLRHLAAFAWVLAVVIGISACSGSTSAVDAHGSEARHIAGLWWLMFGLAVGVYVVVGGFIIVAAVRGRSGTPRRSRISQNMFITVGGLLVPALILLVLAVVTVTTTGALRKAGRDPVRIEVTGERWWWAIRYRDRQIVTANELHIPVGQPVEIGLDSDNVVHSFWVPELAGKVDTIPGQRNVLRFTAEKAGAYLGVCAEFCGIQHAHMGFRVIAQSPGAFERWATAHAQPPLEPASELAADGALRFQRLPCAGCHTVRGTQAHGTVGPDLTDFGSRASIGAGAVANNASNLGRWVRHAQSVKPGALMPDLTLSDDDVQALVAYLESLR
ncbi:MAG TPA: cytochrome c oxidase subunit II [Acidimicrobiia bacterium]|jgi:cytochrome c oxidase subunit 2